jgi:[acyl-carrier-protein] S-malonyltransferase
VANVDGEVHGGADAIRERLVRQVSSPVLWQACASVLEAFGTELVLEVGPGKVLTGLVRRILPSVPVGNVEDPGSLAAASALLEGK